jgi:oligopeptide/dipeptide ABC transporter ATP-binding protein
LTPRQWEDVRGRRIGMVFQDPFTALNPVFTLRDQLGAVLTRHFGWRGSELSKRVLDWMPRVGLPATDEFIDRYPHRLSGGQRQRVAIALALAGEPELLLADEPTTALDVTVQAQILDLLKALQHDTGVAVVFISHDLGVIGQLCHRTAVMYAGRFVEQGPTADLFRHPQHPYTHGLFAARSQLGRSRRLQAIPGNVPPPSAFPPGCAFHPRCSRADERCQGEVPSLARLGTTEIACFHPVQDPA